jgi:hypothetical protein
MGAVMMIIRRPKRERPSVPLESKIEAFKRTSPVGQSGKSWIKERR